MKKLISLMIIIVFIFSGCSVHPKEVVSTPAEQVTRAMLTCPNEDLYMDTMAYTVGREMSAKDIEQAEMIREQIFSNWKTVVGKYFSEKNFEAFMNNGNTLLFHYIADASSAKISIKKIELIDRTDTSETVNVTLLVNSEEKATELTFYYNTDGLIWKVDLSGYKGEDLL